MSVVVQLQSHFHDDRVADSLVGIVQLAEYLDRNTTQIALRIVPREWWEARTATLTTN
jgi:hypothetical protein